MVMPEEYVDDTCSHYCFTELLLPVDPTMKSDGNCKMILMICDRCKKAAMDMLGFRLWMATLIV